MTDEHNPPAESESEPEPGTTEWLLAQLSGGRIASRRERREAEAALATAGVQLPEPDVSAEAPAEVAVEAPVDAAVDATDERPKARFSWETGLLEVIGAAEAEGEAAGGADSAADGVAPGQPAPGRAPLLAVEQVAAPTFDETPELAPAPDLTFDAAGPSFDSTLRAPETQVSGLDETPQAFLWQLAPSDEADPALHPAVELPLPVAPAIPPVVPAAAPLVVPPLVALPEEPAEPPVEPALPTPPTFGPAAPVPSEAEFTLHDADVHAGLIAAPDFVERLAAAAEPTQLIDSVPGFVEVVPAPAEPPERSVDETPVEDIPTEEMRLLGADAAPLPAASAGPVEPGPATPQPPVGVDDADTAPRVTSDWSDIADMLGASPATVENSIVPQWPPVEGSFDALTQFVTPAAAAEPAVQPLASPARPTGVDHGGTRRSFGRNRWLLLAVAVLAAVLVGIALFALGRALANRGDAAPTAAHTPVVTHTTASSPSPTPTATPELPATGPLPVGQTYAWDELRGGECLNPFPGAWEDQYTVVDCTAQHAAQLVYTAPYTTDPAAPFPGQNQISSQINLLCSKPGIVDLTAAAAYTDLQIVASYPVTQEQWDDNQRDFYCFVTRSSGQPLSSSVAGPGPSA